MAFIAAPSSVASMQMQSLINKGSNGECDIEYSRRQSSDLLRWWRGKSQGLKRDLVEINCQDARWFVFNIESAKKKGGDEKRLI